MLYIISAWFFWFFFCFNIGYFFLNRILKKSHKQVDFFYNFWFGLFCLICILQILSLFHPINGKVLVFLGFINLCFLFFNLKSSKLSLKKWLVYIFRIFDYRKLILFLIIALIISYASNLPVTWYDTHLYHLNAVRWLSDYGSVKGLANIHNRLGINNVTFILAALMDNGIFNSSSSHILNSSLFFIFLSQLIFFLFKNSKNNLINLFAFFSILIMSMYMSQINSLSTDLSLSIFVLLSVFYTLKLEKEDLMLALPLYVLAATSKYSFFPALLLLFLFVLLQLKFKVLSRKNLYILLSVFIFFLGFVLRNIVLSGWPFFPLPILGINFKWRVPVEQLIVFNDTVKAWARLPGPLYRNSLGVSFWDWFINWFNNNRESVLMYYFFVLVSLTLAYLFYRKENKRRKDLETKTDFLVLANMVVVLYVFVSAPDFRFMGVFLFVTISLILSYLLSRFLLSSLFKDLTVVVFLFLVSFYFLKSFRIQTKPDLFIIEKEGSGLVKPKTISYSDQEFYVWVPENSDQCGNSQLPCTPYPSGFKMFNVQSLRSGFYSTKEEKDER